MDNKTKADIDRYGNIGFLLGICIITLLNLFTKRDLYDIFTIFFLYTGFRYLAKYKIEGGKINLISSLSSFLIALGNLVSYLALILNK